VEGTGSCGPKGGTNKAPAEKIVIKSQKESNEDTQEVPNHAFALWKAQEQQVLSYLVTSVSRDVLIQITALPSATEV
jgi:hypothetical protein